MVRTKRFAIKPMPVDEAIMQMNLIGHSFFVFRNAETEEVNVIYARKDRNYSPLSRNFEQKPQDNISKGRLMGAGPLLMYTQHGHHL